MPRRASRNMTPRLKAVITRAPKRLRSKARTAEVNTVVGHGSVTLPSLKQEDNDDPGNGVIGDGVSSSGSQEQDESAKSPVRGTVSSPWLAKLDTDIGGILPLANGDQSNHITTVMDYLSSIPDYVRVELQREYFIEPPKPVPPEDLLQLRGGERLASCVPNADFARPCVEPLHEARPGCDLLALNSPITDVFVDPFDGQIYFRFQVASSPRLPPSHEMFTLEEATAYYPQILIDFLLSSVIFRD